MAANRKKRRSLPPANQRAKRAKPTTPSPASRVTVSSRPAFRIRPIWHKVAGGVLVGLGVLVIAVNDLQYIEGVRTLPGGHSEGYLFLGLGVAISSAWWFGLFDRPQ